MITIIKSHKNGALESDLESSYGSGHSPCLPGKGAMVDVFELASSFLYQHSTSY